MSFLLALTTGMVVGFLVGVAIVIWGVSCSRYRRGDP